MCLERENVPSVIAEQITIGVEQVKERLCNYSAQDLKRHDLLRVTTAADAANIVAEMDGLLRERGTLSESTQCPTAEEIFTRMSAYMEAPAAA